MSEGMSGKDFRPITVPVPLERLKSFQERLGVTEDDFFRLQELSGVFLGERDAFASHLYDQFISIPATRVILEHDPARGKMTHIWGRWYESFFRTKDEESFLTAQWNSGLNHVNAGIDHRYIGLAYALARGFLHRVVASSRIDPGQHDSALELLNRLLDLCLLVETDAFITSLSKCDHEIILGIAHQVRNPLMVIGGNVMRLRKSTPSDDPAQAAYQAMLTEAARLERMVRNVTTYNEIFQREPQARPCSLEPLIRDVLDELKPHEGIALRIELDARRPRVEADPKDLRVVFFHLLQNSLENLVGVAAPVLEIISGTNSGNPKFLDIRIFNNGPVPKAESLESLFTPFYSTKALGTGFGLPIARLAVRKNLGHLKLIPDPGRGTVCLVTLPLESADGASSRPDQG